MSKVLSPYPPYTGDITPGETACWWRLRLPMNDDHHYLMQRWEPEQGWMSVEFFDGHDTVIDTGFDKPTKVRLDGSYEGRRIDILSDGPPTPSPDWQPLTEPGCFDHPDNEETA